MLEVGKVLQLKEEFVLYKLEIDKGMFWLFNIENGDSFKLNEISYYILSLFDGEKSVGDIQKCLINKYKDASNNAILKDFNELIEKMEKVNIFKERGCE